MEKDNRNAGMSNRGEQKRYSPLLTDFSKQYITDEIAPMKRIIVTAANKLGNTGIMLVGARHWDKVMVAQWESLKPLLDIKHSEIEQGFIDQYGQFLTRDEAYYVAYENEQPLICEDWGQLYSENLH